MNKKDIEQLAAFVTEDPREFRDPREKTQADDPPEMDEYDFDDDEEAKAHGYSQKQIDDWTTLFGYDDIKVNAQEREAQKRELADIVKQGEEAQQFLSYIESVEHMSRSGLEY